MSVVNFASQNRVKTDGDTCEPARPRLECPEYKDILDLRLRTAHAQRPTSSLLSGMESGNPLSPEFERRGEAGIGLDL
jgi:hypothetical protein